MPNEERLYLLISLQLSGEATAAELEELAVLLTAHPEWQDRLDAIRSVWSQLDRQPTYLAEESFEKHLQKLNEEHSVSVLFQNFNEPSRQRHKQRKRVLGIASIAVAACLFLGWFFFYPGNETGTSPANHTVSTKAGDKASITLPDGSKVWLNGNSKISYVFNAVKNTREVHLSGEAFFDVAKDKTKPFVIYTKTINLKVLGTAFNVRSYDNEKETETALVHGSVEVTLTNRSGQKILLKPGEKLLVKNTHVDVNQQVKPEKKDEDVPIALLTNMHYYGDDSSSVETSWTKSQLVFNDEPFDKIALNLERWFNVRIIIGSESLKKERYTATLEAEDKLTDFLEALRIAGGSHFHYMVKNGEVAISR